MSIDTPINNSQINIGSILFSHRGEMPKLFLNLCIFIVRIIAPSEGVCIHGLIGI